MITIATLKGEVYSFDPETKRIFKDGVLIPSSSVEPVYSGNSEDKNDPPKFSGIYFRDTNSILSLSGKINKLSNPESIC